MYAVVALSAVHTRDHVHALSNTVEYILHSCSSVDDCLQFMYHSFRATGALSDGGSITAAKADCQCSSTHIVTFLEA